MIFSGPLLLYYYSKLRQIFIATEIFHSVQNVRYSLGHPVDYIRNVHYSLNNNFAEANLGKMLRKICMEYRDISKTVFEHVPSGIPSTADSAPPTYSNVVKDDPPSYIEIIRENQKIKTFTAII